jgi:hypothetical protein
MVKVGSSVFDSGADRDGVSDFTSVAEVEDDDVDDVDDDDDDEDDDEDDEDDTDKNDDNFGCLSVILSVISSSFSHLVFISLLMVS